MKRSSRRKSWMRELVGVVARLRAPDGCPWDRKQTHLSLIKYLREEARELEAALRAGKSHEIEDELGDLLLQVLLHSQIAKEKGRFDIEDVARSQFLKLRRRHPHVFGGPARGPGALAPGLGGRKFKTAEEVLRNWSEIKKGERALRRRDVARRGRRRGAR